MTKNLSLARVFGFLAVAVVGLVGLVWSNGSDGTIAGAVLTALLLGVSLVLAYDAVGRKSGTGLLLTMGLLVLFVGERVFGEGSLRAPISGLGMMVVFGAVGLRAWSWSTSSGGRREGHQLALIWSGVVVASLFLYGLTLSPVTSALGLADDSLARWNGTFDALFPIGVVLGLLPTLRLDQILGVHPVVMPNGAARSAQIQGVTAALAIALMFPLNYLAKQHDEEVDVAYFRTTRPGESTLAIVRTLTEPMEAVLFFPAGNDVSNQLRPYFDQLADASGGKLTVKVVDQAFDPKLAEELKIRENGQIVLKQGDSNEKFKIDPDMDRAKKDLRKLDSLVQKNLLKATRGSRTVYFVQGHGEANWRDNENALRKVQLFKKEVLEGQNFKVKTLGVADGLANSVPDDADVVIVAAPTSPLFPEESETLRRYFDGGGSLLVLVDPAGDPMTDLLGHIGVTGGTAPLANAEVHARMTGGPADNVLLATNKYGSHPAVKTLSRNSQVAHMVLPGAVSVEKTADTQNKVTTLIRTLPNTWADADRNFTADEGESKKVYELAVAVTKDVGEGEAKKEARAIVVGSVGWLADGPIQALQANAVFALDGLRWLDHDEDVAGEIESEEDVKVQHTREEDWMWFLTAIAAIPAVVLGAGVLFIRLRRRS
ncbi:MAG: Gldg family protein [Myxococcota bacterium]